MDTTNITFNAAHSKDATLRVLSSSLTAQDVIDGLNNGNFIVDKGKDAEGCWAMVKRPNGEIVACIDEAVCDAGASEYFDFALSM